MVAIGACNTRRIGVVVGDEVLYAEAELMQITNALNLLGFSFGTRNRWK
jgi:hypothetical protein